MSGSSGGHVSGSSLTSGLGLAVTRRYLVDSGGQQVTELNGADAWQHSNIFVASKLSATYDLKGIHYELSDPLGTKRVAGGAPFAMLTYRR